MERAPTHAESAALIDLMPHREPMRLVQEVVELLPGRLARARRRADPGDWYFQGHFPGEPVVPAIVLVELLAQTGGLAAAGALAPVGGGGAPRFRVAALAPFKFPAAALPGAELEASARVVARLGGLVRLEGSVAADGTCVASGGVTLALVESGAPGVAAAGPELERG